MSFCQGIGAICICLITFASIKYFKTQRMRPLNITIRSLSTVKILLGGIIVVSFGCVALTLVCTVLGARVLLKSIFQNENSSE